MRPIVTAAAVYVTCPKCGSNIPSPDKGWRAWDIDSFDAIGADTTITCACGVAIDMGDAYIDQHVTPLLATL